MSEYKIIDVDFDAVPQLTLVRNTPCKHPGCFNHVTHPCEGCGYTNGKVEYVRKDIVDDLLAALAEIRDLARTGVAPMAMNMIPGDWDRHRFMKIASMANYALAKAETPKPDFQCHLKEVGWRTKMCCPDCHVGKHEPAKITVNGIPYKVCCHVVKWARYCGVDITADILFKVPDDWDPEV